MRRNNKYTMLFMKEEKKVDLPLQLEMWKYMFDPLNWMKFLNKIMHFKTIINFEIQWSRQIKTRQRAVTWNTCHGGNMPTEFRIKSSYVFFFINFPFVTQRWKGETDIKSFYSKVSLATVLRSHPFWKCTLYK